jgi:hypothetical protein
MVDMICSCWNIAAVSRSRAMRGAIAGVAAMVLREKARTRAQVRAIDTRRLPRMPGGTMLMLIDAHKYETSSDYLHGQEPTKTLRGALAFFRGASCSVKSRDPIVLRSDEIISPSCGMRVNARGKIKLSLLGG